MALRLIPRAIATAAALLLALVQAVMAQNPPAVSPPAQNPPDQNPPAQSPPDQSSPAQSSPAQSPPAVATTEIAGLRGVFGQHVKDANGDDAGKLWDILVDSTAKPRAAVIDYGGTLGMGERKVAVAWDTLTLVLTDTDAPVHLTLTKQQLGKLPEFKYDAPMTVVGVGQAGQ